MIAYLKQGKDIICDRYAYSGAAYSSAKGIDLNWCKTSDSGLVKPDIVFYFHGSIENIETREGYGEERYERTDF